MHLSGTLGGIHLQGVLATCTFVECSNKQDARICLLESVFISYFALFRTNCEWAAYAVASAVMSCPWDLACDSFLTSVLLSIWIAAWDDAVLRNQYASLVCDSHVWSYFELAAVSRGTGMPQDSFSPLSLASLRCCRGSKCPQSHLCRARSPKQ